MAVNFSGFCEQLNDRIHFTRSGPPGVPFHDPFDVVALQRVIGTNASHLPMSYQTAYSTPLEQRLPAFVASLRAQLQHTMAGASPDDIAAAAAGILEPYIGPVFDIAQNHIRPELRRFQAVISDLYRSFLSDEQRARVQLPLVEKLPPLATFAHKADNGPFTIPSDDMKRDFGITVGVVSLPSSYRDHPIVWPALGHEVGGHDVLHADAGLLPELAKHVQAAIPDKTLGRLWAYWMDEAASDVYGLLNVGPSFAFNLAGFFTALVHQISHNRVALGELGNRSFIDEDGRLDEHPTDLLRLSLALGVIESLHGLDIVSRSAYIEQAHALIASCTGSAKTIDIVRIVPGTPAKLQLAQQFPLDTMQNVARTVGGLIADTKLRSLAGHSIQDIETWDDDDEAAVARIRQAFAARAPMTTMGDDAQVLAAATLELLESPDEATYKRITAEVNTALDASYAQDHDFALRRIDVFRSQTFDVVGV